MHHHRGGWVGRNAFRMLPSDDFASDESEATSAAEAAGWGWSLRYTWVHPQDGPQAGTLLVASPDEDGSVSAAWIDSWHQKPALLLLAGTATDDAVSLEASYAPGWLWQICVRCSDEELTMTMHNVVPEGQGRTATTYAVMQAGWTRIEGTPPDFT